MLGLLKNLHHKYVFLRRINVLSTQIAQQLPNDIRILDIGCGDGTISKMILENKKNVTIKRAKKLPLYELHNNCKITHKII